jgi:hypothetical protein
MSSQFPADIRVNAAFPFPALVQGSGPVTIAKASGVWTVGHSIDQFGAITPTPPSSSHQYVLIFDGVAGTYSKIAVSNLAGAPAPMINVKSYGAVGDGIADDYTAINNAIQSLSLTGGTVFFPPGTYNISSAVSLISNVSVQGSGVGSTFIKNTGAALSPNNMGVIAYGTSTGTTYAINAPVEGGNTVTTTTAADSTHFSVGQTAYITGPFAGNYWFPTFFSKISAVNTSTGVITLVEPLPIGGINWTLIQVCTPLNNVSVSDLTVIQSSDGGIVFELVQNGTVKNCNVTSGVPTAPIVVIGSRDCIIERCNAGTGMGILELFGCFNGTIRDSVGREILIDGGSQDCFVYNNIVENPTTHGITLADQTNRISIMSNIITNITGSSAGIFKPGTANLEGDCIIAYNTLSSSSSGATGIALSNSANNTITGNVIKGFGTGILLGSGASVSIPLNSNVFDNVTTPQSIQTGARIVLLPKDFSLLNSAGATPSVAVDRQFYVYNSSATNITNFTNGVSGQVYTFYFGDANSTLVQGSFNLKGSVNYNPTANTLMQLQALSGAWYELTRTSP